MKLIFVRHGDPDYTNDTLTERGWREAHALAPRVAKWDVDKFYCSPLGRARDTASVPLKLINREAQTKDWLREFYVSVTDPLTGKERIPWDLMPSYWTKKDGLYDRNKWHESDLMKTGEVTKRYKEVCEGIDEILKQYGYTRNGSIYTTEKGSEKTVVFLLSSGSAVYCFVVSVRHFRTGNMAEFLCRADLRYGCRHGGEAEGRGVLPLQEARRYVASICSRHRTVRLRLL